MPGLCDHNGRPVQWPLSVRRTSCRCLLLLTTWSRTDRRACTHSCCHAGLPWLGHRCCCCSARRSHCDYGCGWGKLVGASGKCVVKLGGFTLGRDQEIRDGNRAPLPYADGKRVLRMRGYARACVCLMSFWKTTMLEPYATVQGRTRNNINMMTQQ